MQFKYGNIKVSVKHDGSGVPTWGTQPVYKYRVTVTGGGARYICLAWGSIYDFQYSKHNDKGIGAMVVDELLSAAADPDEFVSLVMGDASGREALKRGKTAEKVVSAAKRFNFDDLSAAVEKMRAQNLL